MFNDEDVKKSAVKGVLYVFCFVCIIGALVTGLVVSLGGLGGAEQEVLQEQTAPTVEFEKDDVTDTVAPTEIEYEKVCEHNFVFSEEKATLIRTVELECVASQGIERVYLTRYRGALDGKYEDVYTAYDKNLKDITIQHFDGVIEIKYFPAGVGMGTPRMEEYEFTVYVCANENCNHMQHVPADKQTLYRFYIPEGTYLITY